eukprot:TRINITY_DN1589_c0_g1_i1.p1 TRINITY_DN1589_c0_g1~~TRINITY_DN1589_c0_g1_i1.p1  ORF type:complete len:144 (+),score=16.35 TRINITY_DN1589_c0_g1_i1:39-434(+)
MASVSSWMLLMFSIALPLWFVLSSAQVGKYTGFEISLGTKTQLRGQKPLASMFTGAGNKEPGQASLSAMMIGRPLDFHSDSEPCENGNSDSSTEGSAPCNNQENWSAISRNVGDAVSGKMRRPKSRLYSRP